MNTPTALLYEHEDGRYAVNPDTTGDPKWHRLGPVDVSALPAIAALRACKETCERIIDQYDDFTAGVDWRALGEAIDRGLAQPAESAETVVKESLTTGSAEAGAVPAEVAETLRRALVKFSDCEYERLKALRAPGKAGVQYLGAARIAAQRNIDDADLALNWIAASPAAPAPDIEFRLRIARLLSELHGEEVLSEQQCAKYMRIDLVSWRKLEACFSAGGFAPEGHPQSLPAQDSETVLRAALAEKREGAGKP